MGGLINYAISSSVHSDARIFALDLNDVVLEEYNITTAAPISIPEATDAGVFRGILRATPDIYGFRLSGSFLMLDDLTFYRVPEPNTLLLFTLAVIDL